MTSGRLTTSVTTNDGSFSDLIICKRPRLPLQEPVCRVRHLIIIIYRFSLESYRVFTIQWTRRFIGKVLLTRAETKHDGVITLQLIGSFLEEIIEGSYRSVQTQGNILQVSSSTVPSEG